MNSKVEGVYDTIEEANRKVEGLRDRGHPRHTVIVVVNEEIGEKISGNINATVDIRGKTSSDDSGGSMWDSIKSAFTSDDEDDEPVTYDKDNDPAYDYQDDIKQGKIVVLLRQGARL
ncbi:hypothetical protein GCM10008932_19340 [Alkalibacterium iburiense]|uniref:General stress protein 17M-like domain-containing protein n=1 Tax=Alkalibacterium iburiense TaxID=290589 RepID=A0ABN0XLX5_9LACT